MNGRIFGKTHKQEAAFREACDRGEAIEYHGANWVAMSRAQYNRLTTQPEEKPKVADSPELGELKPWDTEPFKILESALRHQGISKPMTAEFYADLAELNAYIATLTQPGAGTTLPTSPQTDAVTEEPTIADDNAAPPELGEVQS